MNWQDTCNIMHLSKEREEQVEAASSETEGKKKIFKSHLELQFEKEQHSFNACEDEILPIIHQLRMAFNRGNQRNNEKNSPTTTIY